MKIVEGFNLVENFWLKLSITIGAALVIVAHLVWPVAKIDAITLGLIIILILPWLTPLIKKIELPGGAKIEFQDIKDAGTKVIAGTDAKVSVQETSQPSYLELMSKDPNLALVSLRIEIEKKVRTLALDHKLEEKQPLTHLINELKKRSVLTDESASGLQDIIGAGNKAAHGAEIGEGVADWASDYGPRILAVLDAKVNQGS